MSLSTSSTVRGTYSQFWLDYANGIIPTPVEFVIRDFIYYRELDRLVDLVKELIREDENDGSSNEVITTRI